MGYNEGLCLGSLIDALKDADQKLAIKFDFAWSRPTHLDSYRGYYDDIAIAYSGEYGVWTNVGEFLQMLEHALNRTFTGWKGGEYVADRDSTVWVACPGNATGTYITDVVVGEFGVVLKTAQDDN